MSLISLCGLYLLFLPFVSFPLRVKAPQQSQILPVNQTKSLHASPGESLNSWFPVILTVNPLGRLNVPLDGCPLLFRFLFKQSENL